MALPQRFCTNHPERAAIGVCVMTQKAICGECSTRYEGVNYSREGLALLKQQRLAASKKRSGAQMALATLAWLASPVLLYLLYVAYTSSADILMNILHGEL
jgi:hypothetical protein